MGVLAGLLLMGCSSRVRPAEDRWRGVILAPEQRCSPYDRDDYPYPQSVEDALIEDLGRIVSPYTCELFSSKFDTDIEHIVAVSEAHDSGLCAADARTRRVAGAVRHDRSVFRPAAQPTWVVQRRVDTSG